MGDLVNVDRPKRSCVSRCQKCIFMTILRNLLLKNQIVICFCNLDKMGDIVNVNKPAKRTSIVRPNLLRFFEEKEMFQFLKHHVTTLTSRKDELQKQIVFCMNAPHHS